jgi:Prophage endopeptidase tail/Prophage endopeptidase tail N-terminal domain
LYIRSLDGQEFQCVTSVVRDREVNGDRVITFTLFDDANHSSFLFDIMNEWTVVFGGEEYKVYLINESPKGRRASRKITAIHTFHAHMRNKQMRYGIENKTMTLQEILTMVFDTTNYTFNVIDSFSNAYFEKFGYSSRLDLFKQVLDAFEAEFQVVGTTVMIKKQIGNDTDFQFRESFNIKDVARDIDGSDFSTYGEGYGKLKELQDKLSGSSIPYGGRSGTYYTETTLNKLATKQVNANFTFSFTGTGFQFYTIVHSMGGKWEFKIDNDQKVSISTYKSGAYAYKNLEVIRGLENGTHSVVATFTGKDSNNPNTSKANSATPYNYLLSGSILPLYTPLVGDEQYEAVARYTSPLADLFGILEAPDVRDERFTIQGNLYAEVKKRVDNSLKVSVSFDFQDMRKAGYPYAVPNEGDRVFLVHETMQLDIETRIVKISEVFDIHENPIDTTVTLSNMGIRESYQSQINDAIKNFNDIFVNRTKKIGVDILTPAIKLATEALKSAQTELNFDNGIVAVDKNNPNLVVLLNSNGFGISTDGGQTFENAITAYGINTNVLTAGQINTNNIRIIGTEAYFFWDGNEFTAIDPDNIEKYVKITPGFIDISGGAIRIKRPDGYTVIDNGMATFDFSVDEATPSHLSGGVYEEGRWRKTMATEKGDAGFFTFRHTARYLYMNLAFYADDGNSGYVYIDGSGATSGTNYYTFYTDHSIGNSYATFGRDFVVDLGVPTGGIRSVYVRIKSNTADKAISVRKIRCWLQG